MKFIIFLAIACLVPACAQTTPVKIRVVNSITKAPISGASVTIDGMHGNQAHQLAGRTDSSGTFSGTIEFAGAHLANARHKGYGLIGAGLMGKMIEIRPDQSNETTLEMVPLAVIAGRVLDQYGDPVRHAIVSTQAKAHLSGRGEEYESQFAATTNDRGEYRITNVEPGKYFLVFEYTSGDDRHYSPSSRYQWPEFGGLTIFPSAEDIQHALQVEARTGETTHVPDARLKMERTVTISGRVSPSPVEGGMVIVEPAGPRLSRHQSGGVGGQIEADGTFRTEILPGTYNVRATDRSGKVSNVVAVDAHANVSNVALTLGHGYELTGRIVIDGTEHLDFSKLALHFFSEPVKIDSAGTFHANAPARDASYMLQGLPGDWYVKDVKAAGRTIAGRQFHLDAEITEIVFTLSSKGASVEFSDDTASGVGDVMRAAMFALLPENGIVDTDSMFAAQGSASGKFIVHGVPPGDYRVFALDPSSWALLFDPAGLLQKYRDLAPLVKISEGEHRKMTAPPTKIPVE